VDGHVPCHDVSLAPPDAAYLPIDDDRDIDRLHRAGSGINDGAADQIADQGSPVMRRYFVLLREHHAMSATKTIAMANAAARPTAEERVVLGIGRDRA